VKLLQAHGQSSANVMLVGDYPTQKEYEDGKALIGGSADLLSRLLLSVGVSFQAAWKTSFIKVPLPGYASPDKKISNAALQYGLQLQDWRDILAKEIRSIKPNVIICLGELAMQKVTGHTKIGLRAGSWYPVATDFELEQEHRVMPLVSPRDIYADWKQFTLAKSDLSKIKPYLAHNKPIVEDYKLHIAKNAASVREFFRRNANAPFTVFDIETFRNIITCIGFSFNETEALSIPLHDHTMQPMERALIWQLVWDMLASQMPKVNQNIKFDWMRLQQHGFVVNNIIGDTMIRASTIYPEFPKGLDFLTRIYTDIGYYKDEGREYDPRIHDFNRMLLYNAKDCIATTRVYNGQETEIKELHLQKINAHLQKAFFVYKRLENRGITIDFEQRGKLIDKYQQLISLNESALDAIAGRRLNINSPTQVGVFVYEDLGCPKRLKYTEEKTSYKTGKMDLEELYINIIEDADVADILKKILVIRKLYKVTQFLGALVHPDGKLRTSIRLSGTTSGRTATGKSSDYTLVMEDGKYSWENLGLSYQQIPKHGFEFGSEVYGKDLRKCYVPSAGHEFIEIDLSQAEARVVDVLANDLESLAEYELLDKHWKMAKMCFPELGKYDKKDPQLVRKRQIGKTGKHASNYDESPFAFAMRMHMSVSEATKILNAIKLGNPRIANIFQAEVRKAVDNTRALRTGFGRRREFFDRIAPNTYKEAYAYIPQGMLSDHVKFNILCKLEETTGEYARPLVEWHDSILSEVKIGYREPYIREFKRLAATPITFLEGTFIRDHPLVIPIEAEVGNTWYDLQGIDISGI